MLSKATYRSRNIENGSDLLLAAKGQEEHLKLMK